MANHKSPDVRKLALEYYFENKVSQSKIVKIHYYIVFQISLKLMQLKVGSVNSSIIFN